MVTSTSFSSPLPLTLLRSASIAFFPVISILAPPVEAVLIAPTPVLAQTVPASPATQLATATRWLEDGAQQLLAADYATAFDRFQQALALYRDPALQATFPVESRLGEGESLNGLGQIYRNQGQYDQALSVLQEALTLYQAPPLSTMAESQQRQHLGEGTTLNNIGEVYSNMGDYPQALEYYQAALAIAQSENDQRQESHILHNIGMVYRSRAQYDQAVDYYQQALSLSQQVNATVETGRILGNLGSVYRSLGQYSQALDYSQRGLVIHQAVGNRRDESLTLNGLGLLHYTLGDLQAAQDAYQQALVISREIGDRAGEGRILNNLGLIYYEQGQYPEALDYYQQALTIRQEVGHRIGEGGSLESMGQVYLSQGQADTALSYFHQALAIRQEVGDRAGVAATLNSIGDVYAHRGEPSLALDYYQQALTLRQEIADLDGEWKSFSQIGLLLDHEDQPALAILYYKQAVNVIERIRQNLQALPSPQQQSYAQSVADIYRALADLLLQQDRILEAQQVLDLLKVQELSDYLQEATALPASEEHVRGSQTTELDYLPAEQQVLELYDRAIAQGQELSRLREIPPGERTAEQHSRLAELVANQQALVQQFDDFLASPDVLAAVAQLSHTTQRENLDLRQLIALQDNLSRLDQAVLLYPLILEDRLELILVTPYAPPIQRTVSVGREELNRAIVEFRSLLNRPSSDPRPTAEQLYQWLIEPLEADLTAAGAETILYAPDGPLRYIPLAGLYDGEHWLTERFRVNYITAASLTDFDTPPQPELRVLAGAFTEGRYNVQVGTRQFTFAGLPYARVEVENIAATVPDTVELLDEQFTPSLTIPQMDDYTVIHLATHAEFVPGTPDESFILFGNGDRITLRDMATWTMRHVDLVILSACKTAVGGELGTGEEILGFGYQIQRTGARAAIASLWAVNDGGTQALMTAFYAALSPGTLTKAEALRQAQLTLIHGNYEILGLDPAMLPDQVSYFDHPYYWAPFILIGNGL